MEKNILKVLIGGIFSLAIAMGIGRFSYTVILPYMQSSFHFSNSTAGFLATSNYLGYFIGALMAGKLNLQNKRLFYLRISLFASIASTFLMGVSDTYLFWYVLRFISGVSSAFILVVVSSIVLDYLSSKGKTHLSGIFYSGVGFGIALSGLIVSPLHHFFDWSGTWIGLSLLSILLFCFILIWINQSTEQPQVKVNSRQNQVFSLPPVTWMKWLFIAYTLEGLGYIVTGTFIVSIAEQSLFFNGDAATVWLIAGITAIPSCMIWSSLAKKSGFVQSLLYAMLLQAFGIILPAFSESALSLYVSASLFGATFMGITTLAITLARQILPVNSNKILGYLTASYALGQLLGPTLAGVIATYTNSFNYSLVGAAFVILLGACCLVSGLQYEKKWKGEITHAIRKH